MVGDSICPSCTITQLQGARGVCALRALVIIMSWHGAGPSLRLGLGTSTTSVCCKKEEQTSAAGKTIMFRHGVFFMINIIVVAGKVPRPMIFFCPFHALVRCSRSRVSDSDICSHDLIAGK